MRRITPVTGMIHVTKEYHWRYEGAGLWRCIVSTTGELGWQVGNTLYDAAPFTPYEHDRIIWPFKTYLQLCNTQESSATKKTS